MAMTMSLKFFLMRKIDTGFLFLVSKSEQRTPFPFL